MNSTLYNIICSIAIGWLITHFHPLQVYVNKIRNSPGIFWTTIHKLLTCHQCATLWFALFAYHNIYIAAIASLISNIIDNLNQTRK